MLISQGIGTQSHHGNKTKFGGTVGLLKLSPLVTLQQTSKVNLGKIGVRGIHIHMLQTTMHFQR